MGQLTSTPHEQHPFPPALQQERIFRLLVNAVRDYAIFVLDRDGRIE